MTERDSIVESIPKIAAEHGLDPLLVAAIILQESSGRPRATRYEPGFYLHYVKNVPLGQMIGFVPKESDVSHLTERFLRATSHGLMQLMGQVAREAGFKAVDLCDLQVPEINLWWGCKVFARVLRQKGDVKAALLRWNGGSNEDYPDQVLAHIDSGDAAAFLRPVC